MDEQGGERMRACLHICVCVCVSVSLCCPNKCAQAPVNVQILTCTHTLMFKHEYSHDTCWYMFERFCACFCLCLCLGVCVCLCLRVCVCLRDLWRGGARGQADRLCQLLQGLQGVCRAIAQVPRTSGWMSWWRVMGSHWAYDVKANLMPNR